MSKAIRCDRCRRRLRNLSVDTTWNVVLDQGHIEGYICPNCQTLEENTEAEINEATLDYVGRIPGLGFLAVPRTGESTQ